MSRSSFAQALRAAAALLALSAASVCAQQEPDAADPQPAPETPLDSVIIEAEPLQLERTIEELMRSFREALRRDRFDMPFSERPLPGGAMELNTRFGRFCVVPVPSQTGSDLARGIELAQRCGSF